MRRRRVRTALLAWVTAVVLAWAAATDAPEAVAAALTDGDADVLVTDARGVIVGVGRVVAGASFELRVLDGFVGSARLTLLRPDGATEALEIVVGDGVLVDGLDLLVLLADRVEAFTVEVGGVAYHEAGRRGTGADASSADDSRPGPVPADASGPPDDPPGRPETPGPPDEASGPPAAPPAPPETPGPPDETSGPPADPPGPPDETSGPPADPPGPPETPGPPDDPPAPDDRREPGSPGGPGGSPPRGSDERP